MPERLNKRICEFCGKEYQTHNSTRTCSIKCRDHLKTQNRIQRSETKECPICGEISKLQWIAHGISVCSLRCKRTINSREWRNQHGGSVDISKRSTIKPFVTCKVCGKIVLGKSYKQLYCSRECKIIGGHRNKKMIVDNKRESIKTCEICGVSIDKIPTPRELNFRSFGQRAMDTKVQFDHIVCRVDNGQNNDENLRGVCWMCNHVRGTMDKKFDNAVAKASIAFWAEVFATIT